MAISLNPGQITFEKVPNSDFYDATIIVEVAVQSDQPDWSLNLLGFPLISDQGDIPPDRQYVNKEYNSSEEDFGAGPGYEPMNTIIHLGSGGVTAGYEVINRLQFRILVLDTDAQATYQGEAKIQTADEVYYAILSMILEVKPYLEFSLDKTDLLFEVNGPPGLYDAESPLELSYESNNSEWKINNEFTGISPSNGLSGSSFFVNSSGYDFTIDEGAGEGYMKLNYPREVMNGSVGGYSGASTLNYKIQTDYNHAPGEYTGTFELDSPEFPNTKVINTKVNVSEYLYIEIDNEEVNIESSGPPDIYDGDNPINLKVATNAKNWQVSAEATDLTSTDDAIPNERLYINSSQINNSSDEGAGSGYLSLDDSRIVAEGKANELSEVSQLKLRVKTTKMDKAGDYSGTITLVITGFPD